MFSRQMHQKFEDQNATFNAIKNSFFKSGTKKC